MAQAKEQNVLQDQHCAAQIWNLPVASDHLPYLLSTQVLLQQVKGYHPVKQATIPFDQAPKAPLVCVQSLKVSAAARVFLDSSTFIRKALALLHSKGSIRLKPTSKATFKNPKTPSGTPTNLRTSPAVAGMF